MPCARGMWPTLRSRPSDSSWGAEVGGGGGQAGCSHQVKRAANRAGQVRGGRRRGWRAHLLSSNSEKQWTSYALGLPTWNATTTAICITVLVSSGRLSTRGGGRARASAGTGAV